MPTFGSVQWGTALWGGGSTPVSYVPWTQQYFRSVIRREVMDTNTRWFQDAEINQYIADWLTDLQQEFEFVWAVNTFSIGTVTSSNNLLIINTNSFLPGMQRCDAVYYDGFRLAGRLLQDLEVGDPVWRNFPNGELGGTNTTDTPRMVVMYPDSQNILVWPTPPPDANFGGTGSNIFVFEYPQILQFVTDTSTISGLPVWTQWSCKYYACAKLFMRPGPLNDLNKSRRYLARYAKAKLRIRKTWDNYLPERFRRLQPGRHYEWEILTPPPAWNAELTLAGTNTTGAAAAITYGSFPLQGVVNGVNNVFTFALAAQAQKIFRNGLLLTQGVDYTTVVNSAYTVVDLNFAPSPGDSLVAWAYTGAAVL